MNNLPNFRQVCAIIPYAILLGAAIIGVFFPRFVQDYELLLILIFCPLGVLSYLYGDGLLAGNKPKDNKTIDQK